MPTPALSRRDFLRTTAAVGVASAVGVAGAAASQAGRIAPTADSIIFLMMTGGPSQLDTFDPKPDAPSNVRSPFAPIRTRVPGLMLTELFPKMAGIADKFALIRSVYHDAPPVHEAGFQLLNTGRLFRDGPEWPSAGSVHCLVHGSKTPQARDRHYVAPWAKVDTGIVVGKGFGPGYLADRIDSQGDDIGRNVCESSLSFFQERGWTDDRYPMTAFGQNCLGAFRSVEREPGRFVQVVQFTTVFDKPSWDCHADGGSLACDLGDYKDTVAPEFDAAFTRLILDLEARGLLERTLVVATGEFGRTPKLNSNGGRDHWAGCWTTILAGGGVKGGRVIGASDAIAGEPADRPVHARDIPATIFRALGMGADATIPGPDGHPVRVYEGMPVRELF